MNTSISPLYLAAHSGYYRGCGRANGTDDELRFEEGHIRTGNVYTEKHLTWWKMSVLSNVFAVIGALMSVYNLLLFGLDTMTKPLHSYLRGNDRE